MSHRYADPEVAAVYRAIYERRDMRHFRPDPVDEAVLARLLAAAHRAPSVGYMQPWRFIRIQDPKLRQTIHALAQEEQECTADACGARAERVRGLKLEGILECGELLVVALPEGREAYVVGRRTMPEMDLCLAACAIQNLWLAARTLAVLCLGHVDAFYPEPLLETLGWDSRRPLTDLVFHDTWGRTVPAP